jgi:endonuclease-3
VLSIRKRDEVSLAAARRLFAVAPSPATLSALTVDRIDDLVGDTTFHRAKAAQLREIAAEAPGPASSDDPTAGSRSPD